MQVPSPVKMKHFHSTKNRQSCGLVLLYPLMIVRLGRFPHQSTRFWPKNPGSLCFDIQDTC